MSNLRRWANYDWIAAFVLVPVLFAPALFTVGSVLLALAGVPLYLAWLFWRYPNARSRFNLPILLLLVAVLASLYASVDLFVSLPALCGIMLALVIVYTLLVHAERMSPTKVLLGAWLIGLLVALLTLAAPEPADKFTVLTGMTPHLPDALAAAILALREGRALNANVGAGMLLLVLPLNAFALQFLPRDVSLDFKNGAPALKISARVVRLALLLSFTLMLLAFVATQSRSAFLGLGCALIFLVWMYFPARRPLLAVVTLTLVLLASTLLIQFPAPLAPWLDDNLVGNLPARVEIWTRSLALAQDFPITGVGLGGFPLVANALYPFFIHSASAPPPHAHNLLLQAADEVGILGVMAYLGLLVAFIFCVRSAYRDAMNSVEHGIVLGITAGMLAYQIYGLTDAMGLGTRASLVFWLALAAAGILYARRPVAQPSRLSQSLTRVRSFGGLGVGVLASGLIVTAGIIVAITLSNGWQCDMLVNASAIETAHGLIPLGSATVRLTRWFHAGNAQPSACAAPLNRLVGIQALGVQQNGNAALEKFESALAANSNDFGALLWLARAREERGDTEGALELWKRVGNFRHLRELARAAERDGKLDRAMTIWQLLGDTTRLQELARKGEREGNLDQAIAIWKMLGDTTRLDALAQKSEREGNLDRAIAIWLWLGNTIRLEALANASEKSSGVDRAIRIWLELGNHERLEALARRAEGKGDITHAVKIWRALKKNNELARIARVSEQRGDWDRARALWRELGDAERVRTLAWHALQANDLVRAAAALEDFEALAPHDARLDPLQSQLAEKYAAQNEYAPALAAYQRVLHRNPDNRYVEQRILEISWQSGAARQTFVLLVAALCDTHTREPLWHTLDTFVRASDPPARRALLDAALARDCAARTRAKILQPLAEEAEQQGDWQVAIPIWETLRDAHALRQVLAHVEPKNSEAHKLALDALTRIAPGDSSNYVQLARLWIAEGNYTTARLVLERAAGQRVDSPWFYLLLGDLYRRDAQPQSEIQLYEKALRYLHEPQPLYVPLGVALFQESQFEEASFYLQRAVTSNAADARAHYYLARALWKQDKWQEAMDGLARALCLRPDNAYYRTLWTAWVREAQRMGVQNYPADFDSALCVTPTVAVQ